MPKSQLENMVELGFELRFFYEFYNEVGRWRKCQIIKHGPLLVVC